jgi:hypothetical protein
MRNPHHRLKLLRSGLTKASNRTRKWATDTSLYQYAGWSDIQPDTAYRQARKAAHAANEIAKLLEEINQPERGDVKP